MKVVRSQLIQFYRPQHATRTRSNGLSRSVELLYDQFRAMTSRVAIMEVYVTLYKEPIGITISSAGLKGEQPSASQL